MNAAKRYWWSYGTNPLPAPQEALQQRAGRELLTGIDGVSSQPVRRIVVTG